MSRATSLYVIGALAAHLFAGTALGQEGSASRVGAHPISSPLEELEAGRFWHAARAMRAEGAASGSPEDVLLLSRAEAGWENWSAVAGLLATASWLGDLDGGNGWFLLGRSHEEGERWHEAADAYAEFLSVAGVERADRGPVLARLARVSARAGDPGAAMRALDDIPAADMVVKSWMALELSRPVAQRGDTALLTALLGRVVDRESRGAAWKLMPEARLLAGDTSGATAAYLAAAEGLGGRAGAEAAVEAGRLMLAAGDSTRVRSLLFGALDDAPLRSRGRAAGTLLDLGGLDLPTTLRFASILDQAGDGRRALRAYDQAKALADRQGVVPSETARLARARLMATVRSRQGAALEEFREIHATTQDETIGARNLQAWMALRRRQGRTGDVNTLRRWLLEEYPASAAAAEIVWQRGSSAQSRGDLTEALARYEELAQKAGSQSRAGQARMRTGQILLGKGRLAESARVYEQYLTDFPDGRRWEEAAYWAARTRLELGDTPAARRHIGRIRREGPVSYYAVMGTDLLGEPYDLRVPQGAAPVDVGWLTDGLHRLDRLLEAGLEDGADAEEKRLEARAKGSDALTLRLAEALIERGRTIAGITLGWNLRRAGTPWDRRLLEVVYPFPYREIVTREAAEWGLDPIMLAALIRQESAFEADIVSHAGAVGLMQVMPTTGEGLARAHGPAPFHEANLTAPEVNLHLGAAFFVDMSARYDGDLPLVLSAYNAGPTRATRWRRYPEASDPLRFTERIPFEETRGYVKNVRRNLGLYQLLYGQP
jgi:soluble lytic murein transglycosylase